MRGILLIIAVSLLLGLKAHADPPVYSNVWRPIDTTTIAADVRRNHLSGVGLEQTMMRALLQGQSLAYLRTIKAASKAEPKNATLLAAYGWALAMTKNSYTFGSTSRQVPDKLKEFDFRWQNIRDTIQKAKELDTHCWLAYVAESSLESGGPPPTKEAAALKRAFQIQRNPVTLTHYGGALIFEGAGAGDVKEQREGLRLLLLAEQNYPTYYKASYEIYAAYTYARIANEDKSLAALKRFYSNVPPEYRRSSWVVRYFKFLGLESQLSKIGISL